MKKNHNNKKLLKQHGKNVVSNRGSSRAMPKSKLLTPQLQAYTYPVKQFANDRFRNREILWRVPPNSTGVIPLHPIYLGLARLAAIASTWEEFCFESVRIEYVPTVTTFASGIVTLGMSRMPLDIITPQTIGQTEHSVAGPVYQRLEIGTKMLSQNIWTGMTPNDDPRENYKAVVSFYSDTVLPTGDVAALPYVGNIYLTYDIKFRWPRPSRLDITTANISVLEFGLSRLFRLNNTTVEGLRFPIAYDCNHVSVVGTTIVKLANIGAEAAGFLTRQATAPVEDISVVPRSMMVNFVAEEFNPATVTLDSFPFWRLDARGFTTNQAILLLYHSFADWSNDADAYVSVSTAGTVTAHVLNYLLFILGT